jgi:hypothetical protein
MAFNFHGYGNLFIHPFNFDDKKNQRLNENFKEYSLIY